MRRATYEILEDGTYYGEIEGFEGVYANHETLLLKQAGVSREEWEQL